MKQKKKTRKKEKKTLTHISCYTSGEHVQQRKSFTTNLKPKSTEGTKSVVTETHEQSTNERCPQQNRRIVSWLRHQVQDQDQDQDQDQLGPTGPNRTRPDLTRPDPTNSRKATNTPAYLHIHQDKPTLEIRGLVQFIKVKRTPPSPKCNPPPKSRHFLKSVMPIEFFG